MLNKPTVRVSILNADTNKWEDVLIGVCSIDTTTEDEIEMIVNTENGHQFIVQIPTTE